MCKIIEYSLSEMQDTVLKTLLGLSNSLEACRFLVFKDFATPQKQTLTHGKLRVMQMIPVHEKSNEFCSVCVRLGRGDGQ